MFRKITAILMAVIGIAVVVLGISISGQTVSATSYSHSAGYHDAEYAAFGADFYTYIYEASDIIVDELDSIDGGIEEVVNAQSAQLKKTAENTNAIYKTGGMIIVAIGLAIVASALSAMAVAFTPAVPVMPVQPVQQAPVWEAPTQE